MRSLILSLLLVLTSSTVNSQEKEGVTITVTVENVQNNKGIVAFALHTKETFMKGNGIANASSKVEGDKVQVTFNNVSPGEYAIMVLHDENENNRMDYHDNGMPKESYGMSNNVMSFGPPQYEDAKFLVSNEDLEMSIRF